MSILPSPQLEEWTFRRVVWATLVLASVVFCFWLLYQFSQVIFLLFIAIVLGTVIRPLVVWLDARGIHRMQAAIFVYIVMLALLVGFVVMVVPLIADQSGKIIDLLPGYYTIFRNWMMAGSNQFVGQLTAFLPDSLNLAMPGKALVSGQYDPGGIAGQMLDSAGQVFGYITSAAGSIFTVTAVLLLSFHWTLHGPNAIHSMLLLTPKNQRASIAELVAAMEKKVGGYIVGQAFLCLVIGVMALVAYLLIGLPNPFVLALVAGVLEAVPMVGPLLGMIPAAVIALSMSPVQFVWVIVASIIIQQLENSFLVPRVMDKAVGVNPFVSILAIFSFSFLFGVMGAVMAIPIAAIIQLLLDRYVFHPENKDAEIAPGRDYASRLRYEAQGLAQDLRKQARNKKHGSTRMIQDIDHVMDEIEAITTDLDALLAQVTPSGDQ